MSEPKPKPKSKRALKAKVAVLVDKALHDRVAGLLESVDIERFIVKSKQAQLDNARAELARVTDLLNATRKENKELKDQILAAFANSVAKTKGGKKS